LQAQGNYLTVDAPRPVAVKRDGAAVAKLNVHVRSGYHVNSNTPAEEYLIPLRLRWETGALTAVETVFPKPEMQKYEFAEKPLSVFTGDFEITTRFKAAAGAPAGPGVMAGKLRYQACSNNTCYRPATVEIRLPYEIH
jgi:hypothetical protein